jgi:phenylacetate-coenzyme A ligase PaaK-like adenylate-forming protein
VGQEEKKKVTNKKKKKPKDLTRLGFLSKKHVELSEQLAFFAQNC